MSDSQYLFFIQITSAIAVVGGALFWAACIFFALLARRFEKLFEMKTPWQLAVVAPAGLFLYLIMQALATLRHQTLSVIELWLGYMLLTWSAGLLLYCMARFYKTLQQVEKLGMRP
jgi:hypothetical protein